MSLNLNKNDRSVRFDAINVTTDATTGTDKAYLVDKKLIDILFSRYTKGNLDDLKDDMIALIRTSDSKEDMFNALDKHIYCNNILNVIVENTPVPEVEEASIGNNEL